MSSDFSGTTPPPPWPPVPASAPLPPPRKYRPSAWWFVLPGVLLFLAALSVIPLVLRFVSIFDDEAIFQADGEHHVVELGDAGRFMLFSPWEVPEYPDCVVRVDGEVIPSPGFDFSATVDDWDGFARFETDADEVDIVCEGSTAYDVRVGPAFDYQYLLGGAAGISLALGVLCGVGLLVSAILISILYFTRPRRPSPHRPPA